MKEETANELNRTKSDSHEASKFYDEQINLAFLTGRVVQFVVEVARNAGIPSHLLAERVSEQLGNDSVRSSHGAEEDLSSLSPASSKPNSTTRKVALGRRPRSKLSSQKVRQARDMFKAGASINAVSKKYKVSWKKAHDILKEAA